MGNLKNPILGEFVNVRELTLVIVFVISPKNENLCFKMKILKFLGIQPSYVLWRHQMVRSENFFGDLDYFLLSFLDSDGDKENRKNGIGENE